MSSVDVVIVGGGVAGLSAAAAIASDRRVVLVEREPLLATHASGRNAAIFRPLELDASTAQLARRSQAMFAELSEQPLLARCGVLLASASRAPLQALLAHAHAEGVESELLEGAALYARAASLEGGEVECGVLVDAGGVLDLHALSTALARRARERGAEIRSAAAVARVSLDHGRVSGVVLEGGEQIAAGAVVLAAGAWAAPLGAQCGAALPLVSLRRHLVQLDPPATLPNAHPVVWRVDDETYYRAESGGVLASPCDQQPWEPSSPPSEPSVLELLAQKLARTAPRLANARVRRFWACLRTFAPDRELVVGADPRVRGLYWFTGLGGRGLGVAPAAGELLALALSGDEHASRHLSPARLCAV